MSARRASIDSKMTLASFGGPEGAAGAADAAALAEADAPGSGDVDAAAVDSTRDETPWTVGASLEHPASSAAEATREQSGRCIGMVIASTPGRGKFFLPSHSIV